MGVVGLVVCVVGMGWGLVYCLCGCVGVESFVCVWDVVIGEGWVCQFDYVMDCVLNGVIMVCVMCGGLVLVVGGFDMCMVNVVLCEVVLFGSVVKVVKEIV